MRRILLCLALAGCTPSDAPPEAAPPASGSAPASSPEAAAPFWAVGNEPGWTLRVDSTLYLDTDYGARVFDGLPFSTKTRGAAVFYEAKTDTSRIMVQASEVRCADTMVDRDYSHTVVVVIGGEAPLRGCGFFGQRPNGEPQP